MALSPQITFVAETDCSKITIKDTTVYGGSEPDRVDVTVDFVVTRHPSAGDEDLTPGYDPATVTSIEITDPKDGWYTVDMTIKDATDPFPVLATLSKDFIVQCNANKCLRDKTLKWVEESACGCEDKELFDLISRIRTNIQAAIYKCEINLDLPGARDITEKNDELCLCGVNCDKC